MRIFILTLAASLLLASTATGGAAQEQAPTCFLHEATIVGTEGDDVLAGTEGVDVIVGLGGDDTIDGGGDIADRLCGGDGNDQITDPDGRFLAGDEGNDSLSIGGAPVAPASSGTLVGGDGDDVLQTSSDTLFAILRPGPGNDTVDAPGSHEQLEYRSSDTGVNVDLRAGTATGQGTDTIAGVESVEGSRYRDTIAGTEGNDRLDGAGGRDVIAGRGGSDSIIFGSDRVKGGLGSDWLIVSHEDEAFTTVNLKFGFAQRGDERRARLESIENVNGGSRLIGNVLDNHLYGGPFNDFIDGKRGNDTIKPGGARDKVYAGKGNDKVSGCAGGRDRVQMGPGNDLIDPAGSQRCGMQPHNDFLFDGGAGRDEITYVTWWYDEGVTVDLIRGACHGSCAARPRIPMRSIEVIRGTDVADRLFGDGRANQIFGSGGDDLLNGRGGRDRLDGGDGADDCRNGEAVNRCE